MRPSGPLLPSVTPPREPTRSIDQHEQARRVLRRLRAHAAAGRARRASSSPRASGAWSASCARRAPRTRAGSARASTTPRVRSAAADSGALRCGAVPIARSPGAPGRERRRCRRGAGRRRRPSRAPADAAAAQPDARARPRRAATRRREPAPRPRGADERRPEDGARARALQRSSSTRAPSPGVARSLGAADRRPCARRPTEGSVVTIVVAWELSWYRYEVDLADEAAGVAAWPGRARELTELDAGRPDAERRGRRVRAPCTWPRSTRRSPRR